jgi:hypothetical protein
MISDESVTISKRGRFWAVHDEAGELICICVYKRGALEVARRLALEPQFSRRLSARGSAQASAAV